jgi:AAA domain
VGGDDVSTTAALIDGQSAVDRRYLELGTHLVNLDGLRAIQPPRPLVNGYLFRDSLAWLHGKPGHGKTFAAVDIACCVGTGTAWHRRLVTQGKVLYLIAEGAYGLAARVDAWSAANGRKVNNVHFLPVPIRMMEIVDVAAFGQLITDVQPVLVILDTQARVTVGAEESSPKDMGRFVDNLEILRRHSGACILTVHHEPRNGEYLRGSTALEGAATTILRVNKDGDVVELTNPKQKDAPEQPAMRLALVPHGKSMILSHDAVGKPGFLTDSERHILTTLTQTNGNRGATKTELRDACALPTSTWYRSINTLVNKGLVRERKIGKETRLVPVSEQQEQLFPTSRMDSHDAAETIPNSHTPLGVGNGSTGGSEAVERPATLPVERPDMCPDCGEPVDSYTHIRLCELQEVPA